VAGRADELHPERKGTLAREQRQRQGRLQNAGSPVEPFARLAACDQGARLCAIFVAMMSPARTS
jgi:hypothetical protein